MSGKDMDAVEREVRRRVTDALSSAGLAGGRLAVEALLLLPPDFLRVYRRVWDLALKDDVRRGGSGSAEGKARLKTGSADRAREPFAAGARRQGRRVGGAWVIGDERAFKLKGSIDRKLSRIAKDAEEAIDEMKRGKAASNTGRETSSRAADRSTQTNPVCPSCRGVLRPFLQMAEIKHCPWCGSQLKA